MVAEIFFLETFLLLELNTIPALIGAGIYGTQERVSRVFDVSRAGTMHTVYGMHGQRTLTRRDNGNRRHMFWVD